MSEWDIVLRGGRVIDPDSGLDAVADVAIGNGPVAEVGAGLPAAGRPGCGPGAATLTSGDLLDVGRRGIAFEQNRFERKHFLNSPLLCSNIGMGVAGTSQRRAAPQAWRHRTELRRTGRRLPASRGPGWPAGSRDSAGAPPAPDRTSGRRHAGHQA